MKGISLFIDLKETQMQPTIVLLYNSIERDFQEQLSKNTGIMDDGVIRAVYVAGLDLLNLFFNKDKTTLVETSFIDTDNYKRTGPTIQGARERIVMDWHKRILDLLTSSNYTHKFDNSNLKKLLDNGANRYGGVKQQRQKYTKKNRTNKKYSRKMNKLKQNRKKSLKYYKQNNHKVTKKYRHRK